MELAILFQGTLYLVAIDAKGGPTIHAKGRPIAVPEEIYRSASTFKPNFNCERCGARVRTITLPEQQVQICRCQRVSRDQLGTGYASSEWWRAFRETFKEESRNPAPNAPNVFDPISGEPIGVTKKGMDFMAGKLGFPRPISFGANGQLLKAEGGSSIFSDPELGGVSTDLRDEGDAETIFHALKLRAGIPSTFTIVGDDPDYLFPPETTDIKPLPFKCPNCHVRVKGGHLDYPYVDRIFGCLCQSVYFRVDIPGARSSGEWAAFRDKYFKGRIRHKAADANGNS